MRVGEEGLPRWNLQAIYLNFWYDNAASAAKVGARQRTGYAESEEEPGKSRNGSVNRRTGSRTGLSKNTELIKRSKYKL